MKHAELSWKIVHRVLVAHSTEGPVNDATFQKFVETQRSGDFRVYIAATTGSTELTSLQRKASADTLAARQIVTYVVTDSRLVRGIVTAASWLGLNAKPFAWKDIAIAVAEIGQSLGLSPGSQQEIVRTIHDMKAHNDAKARR